MDVVCTRKLSMGVQYSIMYTYAQHARPVSYIHNYTYMGPYSLPLTTYDNAVKQICHVR